jgi:hypothetical protein
VRRPLAFGVVGIVAAALGGAAFAHPPWRLELACGPGGQVHHPVGAVEFLRAHAFAGNLLTTYGSGAFVSWELHPAVKVSFDARYEVAYPASVYDEHVAFWDAATPGWDRILDRYPVDAALVEAGMRGAARLRSGERPGWVRVYADDVFELYAPPRTAGRLVSAAAVGAKPAEP